MSLGWTVVWSIAAVSWLLSLYLLYKLWRGPGFPALKVGLTVVLAAPVLGPFFYFWIMGIPEPMTGHLREEDPDFSFLGRMWKSRKRRVDGKKR